ncbi:MAG: metallopeptidase family protein [Sphingomonadaceae bacterium]
MSKGKGSDRRRRVAQLRNMGPAGEAGRRERFERLVADALRQIPEPFRSRLDNVAVIVEEYPDPELLESLGMSRDDTLLGYYEGIPLTERGDWYNLTPPDRIILYRRPILAVCQSPDEIREEVRRTVLHEVAHFYGISDEELGRMGLD